MEYSSGAWIFAHENESARDAVDAGWTQAMPRSNGDDSDCIALSESDLLDVESC